MTKRITDKQRKNSEGRKRRIANLKPWQPGQSGNPAGRPKTITLSEAYRQALARPFPDDPQGRTYAEVIAGQLVKSAAAGEVSSAREIADRTEGKPRQALEVDMTLLDWREMARQAGVDESDVIDQARRIIQSSLAAGSTSGD